MKTSGRCIGSPHRAARTKPPSTANARSHGRSGQPAIPDVFLRDRPDATIRHTARSRDENRDCDHGHRQLDAALARVAETALFGGTGLEPARNVIAIAGTVLDARIAEARGSLDAAIGSWRGAAASIDRLAYDEPPVWFYPVRESLGAALLKSGRPADAEQVFRDDLARHPRNARSLFGLHEALVRQHRDADAAWVDAQFREAWKNAGVQLTLDDL